MIWREIILLLIGLVLGSLMVIWSTYRIFLYLKNKYLYTKKESRIIVLVASLFFLIGLADLLKVLKDLWSYVS